MRQRERMGGVDQSAHRAVDTRGVLALMLAAATLVSFSRPLPPLRGTDRIAHLLAESAHAGDCETCHTQHANAQPAPQPHALVGPDDNTLCDDCHTTPWSGGSYPDTWTYAGSAHGSEAAMIWPGPYPPSRVEPDAAGKCVNCHDPHGWEDASGLIPRLAIAREEALCLTCHDGHPAASNVRADLLKAFRHPVMDIAGRHTGPAESQPADFAVTPVNRRHAECEDCHNPHVARGDGLAAPDAPAASKRLLGVSRVGVLNGVAGSAPSYTFIVASDTLTPPVAEFQLCFKCHSSWTTQPAGQTDLARALNPNNLSTHPVEAAGNNRNIHPLAFVAGWSASSLTRCGDCHGSELGTTRGPHGSSYRYILTGPYTASPAFRPMASDEVCFSCHAFDVYANPSSPESVRGYSRFSSPNAVKGHAEHVGEENVPCYACHATHGAPTQKHLIATGRAPGIVTYTETATGGSCAPTCHGSESYTVGYAR